MKKKIAVALLSVILSLSVFGCGNGKKVSSSGSSATADRCNIVCSGGFREHFSEQAY